MRDLRSKDSARDRAPGFPGLLDTEVGRKEFLKRTALLAGSVLLAGSLGALAGCGGTAVMPAQEQGGSTGTVQEAPPVDPGVGGQSSTQAPTAAVDCPFYDNGTCKKTGETCTNCIAR